MIKDLYIDHIAYSEIRNHYLFLRLIPTSTNRGECLSPKDCESAMKFKPNAIVPPGILIVNSLSTNFSM